jgi:outer membrane biosynthesis protein TonB
MRMFTIVVAAAVLCSVVEVPAQEVKREVQASARTPEDAAKMIGSARYLYHAQVHTILQAAVTPEFIRHHERLKGGTVKYAFELDAQGHVVSVKTRSTRGSRWGEQTVERIIRSLKFPAVPPQAMKQERQEGHKYIEVTGDMGWEPPH